MDNWPYIRIGDVAEIFDGPHATPKTISEGPIFLGIGSLNKGRIELGETRHVTREDFKTWTRRVKPIAGDVVFSYETRIGEAAIIPDGLECCLGRRMGLVRTNRSQLNPRFLLYTYLSPTFQDFLKSRTITGATVDRIPLTEFPDFPVPLPPISVQDAIVSVLGALDDKIDLNRRMNETLEAMARAIFKDWFVDFGPSRAKMEGCEPYLAPEIWALFPDRLDDEGKPEGWNVVTADAFCKSVRDGTHASPKAQETGRYLITSRHIMGGEVDLSNAYRISQAEFDEINRRSKVEQWDILITMIGTVGEIFLVTEKPDFAIKNIGLFKSRDRAHGEWLYQYLKSPLARDHIKSRQSGTTQSYIALGQLRQLPLTVPPIDIIYASGDVSSPLVDQIASNLAENRLLSQTRELLLPKLMSGEIRLNCAEKILEDAL